MSLFILLSYFCNYSKKTYLIEVNAINEY